MVTIPSLSVELTSSSSLYLFCVYTALEPSDEVVDVRLPAV